MSAPVPDLTLSGALVAPTQPGARSCLVCHKPTTSEGQLCPTCVSRGARVENGSLYIELGDYREQWS